MNGAGEKRVLIVEDDRDIAWIVADVLRDAGYQADIANPLETAVEQAVALACHAVILDIHLGADLDGFVIADSLRSHPKTQAVPIIVLTAHRRAEACAAEVGTPYYLAKPFDISEIEAIVSLAVSGTVQLFDKDSFIQ